MKKFFITIAIIVITMINFSLNAQNVGIGSSNFTPDNSAGLEIKFTDKGLLIPRVALTSATDATTIPSPATSLLVYNLGTGGLSPAGYYYWDGSQWVKFATGSSIINGNGTATQVAFWSGTNTLSSDAGLYWDNSNKRLGIGTNAPTTMLEINGPVMCSGPNANLDPSGSLDDIIASALTNSGKFVIGYNITGGGGETDFITNRGTGGIGGFTFYDYTNNGLLTHIVTMSGNGNVGIGTSTPSATLHVNGNFRLVDGSQGAGKVLTSDANGQASWQSATGGIMQWITPIVILSGFTGHHSTGCSEWQYKDPTCSCGYYWDGYQCSYTYLTSSTNNGCPCVTYASYPAEQTNYNWQTVNLSSLGLPAGIRQLYIEIDYAISEPDYGDVDAFVLARANSSSPTYPVAKGKSAGDGDSVSGLNSTMIPVDPSTNSFQYAVEYPGFNQGVTIRILAYN